MRIEPVTIAGLEAYFCSNIRLSHRLKWRRQVQEDEDMMAPVLFSYAVVNESGAGVKSADEWDQWAGDNREEADALFDQCLRLIGTVDEAKKK